MLRYVYKIKDIFKKSKLLPTDENGIRTHSLLTSGTRAIWKYLNRQNTFRAIAFLWRQQKVLLTISRHCQFRAVPQQIMLPVLPLMPGRLTSLLVLACLAHHYPFVTFMLVFYISRIHSFLHLRKNPVFARYKSLI